MVRPEHRALGGRSDVARVADQPDEPRRRVLREDVVDVVDHEGALAPPARLALRRAGTPRRSPRRSRRTSSAALRHDAVLADRMFPRVDVRAQERERVPYRGPAVRLDREVAVGVRDGGEVAHEVRRVRHRDLRVRVEDQPEQVGTRALRADDQDGGRCPVAGRGDPLARVATPVSDIAHRALRRWPAWGRCAWLRTPSGWCRTGDLGSAIRSSVKRSDPGARGARPSSTSPASRRRRRRSIAAEPPSGFGWKYSKCSG